MFDQKNTSPSKEHLSFRIRIIIYHMPVLYEKNPISSQQWLSRLPHTSPHAQVPVYARIRTKTHARTRAYQYKHASTQAHMRIDMHAYTNNHAHIPERTQTETETVIKTRSDTWSLRHRDARIHIDTRTNKHTHTHTHPRKNQHKYLGNGEVVRHSFLPDRRQPVHFSSKPQRLEQVDWRRPCREIAVQKSAGEIHTEYTATQVVILMANTAIESACTALIADHCEHENLNGIFSHLEWPTTPLSYTLLCTSLPTHTCFLALLVHVPPLLIGHGFHAGLSSSRGFLDFFKRRELGKNKNRREQRKNHQGWRCLSTKRRPCSNPCMSLRGVSCLYVSNTFTQHMFNCLLLCPTLSACCPTGVVGTRTARKDVYQTRECGTSPLSSTCPGICLKRQHSDWGCKVVSATISRCICCCAACCVLNGAGFQPWMNTQ